MLGIPNFLNVITNLPFFFFAVAGILEVKRLKEKELKQIMFTLFTGFLLLTFGSAYYHWAPQNASLVYDRVPIVIVLMSFFAFIIHDSFNKTLGYKAFFLLNVVGILTVVYWIISEAVGRGDLRWYGMVQFFPVIAIPLILILYKTSFKNRTKVVPIFIFFALGKFTEKFDSQIYHLLNNALSGHSLKHLLMAASEYQIVKLMHERIQFQYQ